jgi:hypothetical protein
MLYPYVGVRQGAEGVNVTALGSLAGIVALVAGWLFFSAGGLSLFSQPAPDFIDVAPSPTPFLAEFGVLDMFAAPSPTPSPAPDASPSSFVFMVSAPPSPTPTDWQWPDQGWSDRGCIEGDYVFGSVVCDVTPVSSPEPLPPTAYPTLAPYITWTPSARP